MNKDDIRDQIRNKTSRIITMQRENDLYHIISTCCSRRRFDGKSSVTSVETFVREMIGTQYYADDIMTIMVNANLHFDDLHVVGIQDLSDDDPIVMLLKVKLLS